MNTINFSQIIVAGTRVPIESDKDQIGVKKLQIYQLQNNFLLIKIQTKA